jgi:predicted secreted protein
MAYTSSAAFSPRGTQLLYQTSDSIGFQLLAEIKQADFSGQKLDLADVTNFQSGQFREYLATLLDSGELTFKGNFIPSDASQAALLGFFNAATRVTYKVALPINPATGLSYGHFQFLAFVSTFEWALPIDKEATISGKLKITGPIAFVAGS